jgi:hypothetical protein
VFNPVILVALLSRNGVVRIFLVDFGCFAANSRVPRGPPGRSQLLRPPHQLPLLLALPLERPILPVPARPTRWTREETKLCGECEFVKLRTHPTENAVCSSEFPPVKHVSSSPCGRQKPWPMGSMLQCGKSRGSFVSVRYLSALADAQYLF